MADTFPCEIAKGVAKITIAGRLDTANAPVLSDQLKELVGRDIKKVVFFVHELEYISSAGLRAIVFAKQKMGADTEVFIIAPQEDVVDVIKMTGFDSFLKIQDSFGG